MATSLTSPSTFFFKRAQPLTSSFTLSLSRSTLSMSQQRRTLVILPRATASNPTTGKREPRGIMKPRPVSPEMQELVGASEIPRTQALKLIWAHIKENNLQDPENKKVIVCDEKLKKIFAGKERVGFLEIAGLISPHFLK